MWSSMDTQMRWDEGGRCAMQCISHLLEEYWICQYQGFIIFPNYHCHKPHHLLYNTHPMTFEVMSHSAMYNLAHCQLVGNVASGALWMPMGNPANAFRSDFPVEGRPHSIGKPNTSLCSLSISIHTGMPGIYTWASIRTGEQKGSHHTGAKKRWVVKLYQLSK